MVDFLKTATKILDLRTICKGIRTLKRPRFPDAYGIRLADIRNISLLA